MGSPEKHECRLMKAQQTHREIERDRGRESHRTQDQDTQNEGYQKITKQRALGDKPQKPTTM